MQDTADYCSYLTLSGRVIGLQTIQTVKERKRLVRQ